MDSKHQLNELNRSFKNVHRQFLENERVAAEIRLGHNLPPLAFYNLLTKDQNFAWMHPFSALIAEIDEFVDDHKHVSDDDLAGFQKRIDEMLSAPESMLADRYRQYLVQDSGFVMAHAELKLRLSRTSKPKP